MQRRTYGPSLMNETSPDFTGIYENHLVGFNLWILLSFFAFLLNPFHRILFAGLKKSPIPLQIRKKTVSMAF